LLEKDISCGSSNEESYRDKTLSRRSHDAIIESGRERKGNQSLSPAHKKPKSVFSKGSVFSGLHLKGSKKVLPSLGGESHTATEGTNSVDLSARNAMPLPAAALQPIALHKPKVPTQLSLADFEEMPSHDRQRRLSVLESFSSTLSEVRGFFSHVFHSSDRVYAEEGDPCKDKILPSRTAAQSEFSLSHRNYSSRNSSLRTMRSKQPSDALPSLRSP
jgi:hypothetical protein